MGNILFITDISPDTKSGAGVNGNMHKIMVNELAQKQAINLYVTSDYMGNDTDDIVMKGSSKIEKVISVLQKYPPYLNVRARMMINKIVKTKEISIVYIDNSVSGKLIANLKKKFPNIKYISFFHDIEIVKMANESKQVSFFRRAALSTYFYNEKCTAKYADATIVLNERDRQLYLENYGKEPTVIAPICIPDVKLGDTNRIHSRGEKIKLLFVGVDYGPNIDGIKWFQKEVSPLIKCAFELNIVGYKMEKYRDKFENDYTNVIGTVDSLDTWYENADIVIAPIFEGGGMKVKTAESLMRGKNFVGCSESLTGYWEDVPSEMKGKNIYKCDSPEDFAHAIEKFYLDDFYINDVKIHDFAESLYSYKSIFEKYKKVFENVTAGE